MTTDLETLLVVLQADVGAELFDVRAEPDAVLAQAAVVDLGLAAAAVGHAVLVHLQAGLIAELDTWERLRRAIKLYRKGKSAMVELVGSRVLR